MSSTLTRPAPRSRSHCAATDSIVDETVAAHEAAARVVPRRPAEREGGALAPRDQARRGQCHVVARPDRVPGALDQGRARVHRIEPEQAVDVGRRHVAAQSPHRPDERHGAAGPPRGAPHRPGPRQEVDVVRAMHDPRGLEPVGLGRHDRPETHLLDPRPDDLGASRHLERRDDLARHQLPVAAVPAVPWRKDRVQPRPPCLSRGSLARRRDMPQANVRAGQHPQAPDRDARSARKRVTAPEICGMRPAQL